MTTTYSRIEDNCQVSVPEGKKGCWSVEKFEISESEARFASINCHGRPVSPGCYTRLLRNGSLVMSDTPMEISDHLSFIYRAKGHVLINGLGLGMCLQAVLENPEVTKATVIEISQDVIDLVAPHYQNKYGDRVEIICADAFEWKPPKGAQYGAIWHDIFDGICSDNLPSMTKLKRKYARKCQWQGCWGREQIRGRW